MMSEEWREILVLGLGVSGFAVAELALRAGAAVTVLDSGDAPETRDRAGVLRERGARVHLEWNDP